VSATETTVPRTLFQRVSGRALVLADVDLIVFTGSRETGKRILADAGPGLKRVILELGGKDPLVVLDDADLDAAAAFAVRSGIARIRTAVRQANFARLTRMVSLRRPMAPATINICALNMCGSLMLAITGLPA
jgi:hypothetical protein